MPGAAGHPFGFFEIYAVFEKIQTACPCCNPGGRAAGPVLVYGLSRRRRGNCRVEAWGSGGRGGQPVRDRTGLGGLVPGHFLSGGGVRLGFSHSADRFRGQVQCRIGVHGEHIFRSALPGHCPDKRGK